MASNEVLSGDQPCQCGIGVQCSEALLSLSSGVYVMTVMFAHYIHTQSCHLSQPRQHGEWWAVRQTVLWDWSQKECSAETSGRWPFPLGLKHVLYPS